MKNYYVYQLVDPRNNQPFYIGKGSGNRATQHSRFKDGNNNPYKDRKIKNILKENLEVIVEFLHTDLDNEIIAYDLEEAAIRRVGIDNLTNLVEGRTPPSRRGKILTKETLEKRSKSLKGIPRTEIWCERLSLAKQGKNNPMYGRLTPCSEEKRLSILQTKNLPNYDLYKQVILKLNEGKSACSIAKEMKVGKGVCCKLKNGSHGIFDAFPELRQLKTC